MTQERRGVSEQIEDRCWPLVYGYYGYGNGYDWRPGGFGQN